MTIDQKHLGTFYNLVYMRFVQISKMHF